MTATVPISMPRAAPRVQFTQPLTSRLDVARVGGKAHALSRMARLGVRVPSGFVITTAALESHLAANELSVRLDDICAALDTSRPAGFHSAADTARRIVTAAKVPESVLESVFDAAVPLLDAGLVVVRSSAVGEDSARGSFAGQLDSFLHVRTPEQLQQAVLDCWASYWSERALFYRVARGVPLRGMAIVVQQQVDACAAGVLFTNAGGDALLVEYTPGLADALVAGRVNPGRFAIARHGFRVRKLAEPDTRDARAETLLFDAKQITSIAELAIDLERSLGGAQDVEWVMDHAGAIHVVQSRPITASIVLPSGAQVVWSNANVNENFPTPISPLLYSIASAGYAQYFRGLASAFGISARRRRSMEPHFQQIIGVHGARMYYNLSSIHSVLRAAPFGEALASAFNRFVGAEATAPPPPSSDRFTSGWLSQLGELCVVAMRTTRQYIRLGARVARFERRIDALATRTADNVLSGMSLLELRDALREVVDIRCHRWTDAALADAAAMVSYSALARLLARVDGDNGDSSRHNSLLRAIPDVVSSQPAQRLWALSRMVRADAALHELFHREAPPAVLECVRREPAFEQFRRALEAYLDDWGFRCSGELMLTVPTFQEDAAPIIDVIRTYARMDGASPADAMRAQAAERKRETRRMLEELRRVRLSPRGPFVTRAHALRIVLPLTHAAIRFRERARLKQALLYNRCRRIALAIGKRLAEHGTLDVAEHIFWLTVGEIDELLSGSAMLPHAVRDLAALRERAHAEECACVPPDRFTLAAGAYRDGGLHGRDGSDYTNGRAAHSSVAESGVATAGRTETLEGVAACGGSVTARATVLSDVSEASRLERGDVLVTRQTDPGWGPVFFLIGGLVIERGGMLSHGAIIAREFGIPCVVGVKDATKRIPDGCMLAVDGGLGHARIVG